MNTLKIKNKFLLLFGLLIVTTSLLSCDMSEDPSIVKFNSDPNSYRQAAVAPDISMPDNIVNNIEKQPLYIIPTINEANAKNQKSEEVTVLPPTLIGKVKQY